MASIITILFWGLWTIFIVKDISSIHIICTLLSKKHKLGEKLKAISDYTGITCFLFKHKWKEKAYYPDRPYKECNCCNNWKPIKKRTSDV